VPAPRSNIAPRVARIDAAAPAAPAAPGTNNGQQSRVVDYRQERYEALRKAGRLDNFFEAATEAPHATRADNGQGDLLKALRRSGREYLPIIYEYDEFFTQCFKFYNLRLTP